MSGPHDLISQLITKVGHGALVDCCSSSTDSWILESLLDAMIVVVLVVNIVGYSAITITPPLSDAPADLSGRMVRWLTLTVVADPDRFFRRSPSGNATTPLCHCIAKPWCWNSFEEEGGTS